jgi:hypothetical protein
VRRELLDGVLLVSPSPSSIHQVYQLSGTFKDTVEVDQPWRIEIPIDGLRPRNM